MSRRPLWISALSMSTLSTLQEMATRANAEMTRCGENLPARTTEVLARSVFGLDFAGGPSSNDAELREGFRLKLLVAVSASTFDPAVPRTSVLVTRKIVLPAP